MRIETLSYQINWRNFKKGYSFFVPCINVVAAREEISRVTCRLKIEVITKVVIEDYAWIGARAMILPGVTIGKGAVLGASAVATKNVPEYSIFAGIPAKQIGIRSRELRYQLNYSPYFQ